MDWINGLEHFVKIFYFLFPNELWEDGNFSNCPDQLIFVQSVQRRGTSFRRQRVVRAWAPRTPAPPPRPRRSSQTPAHKCQARGMGQYSYDCKRIRVLCQFFAISWSLAYDIWSKMSRIQLPIVWETSLPALAGNFKHTFPTPFGVQAKKSFLEVAHRG